MARYWTELIPATVEGRTCWVAAHPQLGSVVGQGDTQAEAVADLAEAREAVLRVYRDCGDPIPDPDTAPLAAGRLLDSGGTLRVCCVCREMLGLQPDEGQHLAAEWEARHLGCGRRAAIEEGRDGV